MEYQEVYVVFDGLPAREGPRFIEVESVEGHSVKVEWQPDRFEAKGYYRLGPFYIEKP